MFKGSIPALITPFDAQGEVDKDLYQKFVDWQVKQGSHGLVPVGTTGESPTLSHEEHHLVVDLCVEAADGRVPVMAGTGSNSTREAITLTQHAERAGVAAALVVTPYYNKPSQEGLYQHFKAIHDETNLPIYIYNIPGRSIVDMTVETMARLFELPRIVGVKDATGDLSRVSDQRTLVGEDFTQLSGDDPTTLGFMAMGGHGAISVTANVAPALCSKFQEACMNGQYDVALGYQDKLIALHHAMFIEPSPAPAKFALSCIGIGNDYVRRPLVPLTEAGRTRIRNVLAELSLDTVSF